MVGLGFGGTNWNSVTGSRSFGTNYVNSRSYPIMVAVTGLGSSTNWDLEAFVNGLKILQNQGFSGLGSAIYNSLCFIVPAGATYSVVSLIGLGLNNWCELY
jgi:hypothetical protein